VESVSGSSRPAIPRRKVLAGAGALLGTLLLPRGVARAEPHEDAQWIANHVATHLFADGGAAAWLLTWTRMRILRTRPAASWRCGYRASRSSAVLLQRRSGRSALRRRRISMPSVRSRSARRWLVPSAFPEECLGAPTCATGPLSDATRCCARWATTRRFASSRASKVMTAHCGMRSSGWSRRRSVGEYRIVTHVLRETMDSQTLRPPIPRNAPGGYFLKDVLWTQYFAWSGESIH
jgi:hypothetical protein